MAYKAEGETAVFDIGSVKQRIDAEIAYSVA